MLRDLDLLHMLDRTEDPIRPSWPITATADIDSNPFLPCVGRTCYVPLVSSHLDTQGPTNPSCPPDELTALKF